MSIRGARPNHRRRAGSLASRLATSILFACSALAADGGHAFGGQQGEERPRVGLALGGGSAKGIAHAGVLRWLEDHRIPVDAIAGTSTGALIGGAYATGLTAAEIRQMVRDADWDGILRRDSPYPLKSYRRKEDDRDYAIKLDAGLRQGFRLQSGLNPGHGIGLWLSRVTFPYSSLKHFDDLVIPFRCLATDLEKGEPVVLESGPLGPALRASMALPGRFDPVRLGGRLLSDGGILNNVPVDVLRGMGAGFVIAVNVGAPESGPPAETMGEVTSRAIELMRQSLDKPRLRLADVVILPAVEEFNSTDFQKSEALMERGYAAAQAMATALLPYALSTDDWAAHLAARARRRRPLIGSLSFVEVNGVSASAASQIAARFESDLSNASDPATIESHLDWVIGHGRYASAMYHRRLRGEEEGLAVEIRDKSYAPPLVKFSLDLDNENKDVNLTIGSRITLMDIAGLGSEWRIDASLGSTLRLGTELLRPLGGDGPLRRGAFIAPRVQYVRTTENLYAGDELTAIYSRQRAGVGLDVGWIVGSSTQIRAGYEAAYIRNEARVGESLPRGRGAEHVARVRLDYDGLDRAHFPTRGVRLSSAAAWMVDTPEGLGNFGRVEGGVSAAWRKSGHVVTLSADGGASLGRMVPLLYQFSLGGPNRLGAFPPNAFRGPNFALGRVAYRTDLGRLPNLLGDRFYLVGMAEAGSAFDRWKSAEFKPSLTAGFAADTFFGPFFLGGSLGSKGAIRAYFLVGASVRQ